MKIDQVEIYKMPIKLKKPFIISLGAVNYAENVIVVIRTDNGITGFGECSPFRTINGESMDTAFTVGQYIARSLIGINPADISECTRRMNNSIFGNSSIKSAFDIALYDIAAQFNSLPLYLFLGGNKSRPMITDYTVSIGDPESMAAEALKIAERGFIMVKVKLGRDGKRDIDRINEIREKIGYEIAVRVDANQGWGTIEAVETLNALHQYKIEFCEEPISRHDYMDLAGITLKSPVPVMADESCCDHHDSRRLISLKACHMFNIKLGKSGGIFNALKIIGQASDAGIKMQVGGFLESRLGFTASAHLASISPFIEYFDFDSPLMMEEDPVTGGIVYGDSGTINLPDTPGLGASVDEKYLGSLESVIIR